MQRWRARLGPDAVTAALGAALASVLAVGWSAGGAVSGLAPADAGSLQVSPAAMQVSQARTDLSPSGEVSVAVPAGWTSPSLSPGQAGYISASNGQLSVSGPRITLTGVALGSGQHVGIPYAAVTVAPVGGGQGGHGRMPDGLPILLVVAGLVLAAAVAALLAFRPLASGPRASRPRASGPRASGPRASRPRRRDGHGGGTGIRGPAGTSGPCRTPGRRCR
ncbi:MAG TPA: hypothetical protein VKU77_02995 [Streptosporangiaceae bacterium]|nr:hypothetical protein [Streptosporangiaceae bacterium]